MKPSSFTAAIVAAAFLTAPALAQQSGPSTNTPPAAGASAPSGATLPGVTATTNNPNLAVASIKLEKGTRLGKIIGADVYGQGGQQLGKVDDLIMNDGDHVIIAVISAGGFLGLGSKLVAFPFAQLKMEGDRLTLPDVTPDALNAAPSFQY